ncbi:MAG: hypothetical protein HEP71_07920 [Roseivirga sp.]|nr:hypothetical protein [Roseivirga sp.]
MPIEIRELVIKTSINEEDQPTGNGDNNAAISNEDLISECVARVMDLMKQQTER